MDSPGTTAGVDAPESTSSSADASTGFDFSGDSFFSGSDFTPVSDPFSYYDPVTEAYFAGSPSTGGAAKDYGIDSTDAYYNYVPGLAPNAVAQAIRDDNFFAALSERLGAPLGVENKDYNARYVAPGTPAALSGTAPTPSYTTTEGDYGQNIFSILDQGITGMQTGTSGRGQLDALSAAGLGNMPGMNPNNPTQTVDQLINSYRAGNFLDKYAPTIFGAATGFGPQMSAIRMGADVLSGKTTPGQALTGLGLDFLAGKAGLPGGGRVLGDVLDGRMDRAASGLTQAGLAAALGRAANIRAPFADIALQETGIGPKAGAAVGSAVGPSQPTGVTSSITQLFDKGLGGLKEIFSGLPQGGAGTAGTAPTAQTGGVPYYGYASDSSPDSPATVAAPAAPAAPTTPEVQAAQRLLYGIAQGPYGPLLAYDIGGRG